MGSRRRGKQAIGVAALFLLLLLFLTAIYQERQVSLGQSGETRRDEERIVLSFEPEILEYDGSGPLDLMEGVTAIDPSGRDVTGEVQAVLTADGTGNEKKIRYSVFAENGAETTTTRTLRLEGYTGPQIQVQDPLELTAEDLDDLVHILANRELLTADDGFGNQVLSQVSWVRRRQAKGVYTIRFELRNDYQDAIQVTAEARISGQVSDIELELAQTRISIPTGSSFYPMEYVAAASDPQQGDLLSQVKYNSSVDPSRPGSYVVSYTLTSLDGTQEAEAVLQVTVTGEGSYD